MLKRVKIKFAGYNNSSPPFYLLDILKNHYEVVICEDADYLIIGSNAPNHHIPTGKDRVTLFSPGEAIFPDFNLYDYAIGFDHLAFGDRYLRHLFFPYSMQRGVDAADITDPLNRKFCNFIYRNSLAHPARDQFFHLLSKNYRNVESLGSHLRNTEVDIEPRNGNWYQGSIDAKSKYKFSIAFENAYHSGYTTEKITSSFQARTIPIYWGNPDVGKDLNPESFINCHDFSCAEAVVEEVHRLDTDNEAYLEMLNAPTGRVMEPDFFDEQRKELEQFLCHIFSQDLEKACRRPSGYWNEKYQRQLSRTADPFWKRIFR